MSTYRLLLIHIICGFIIVKINKYVIMPAYSIGKQQKKASFVSFNNVPGAGAYNSNEIYTSKVTRKPTCIIGKTARLKTQKYLGPGPSSYDLMRHSFFGDKSKGVHIVGKNRQRIRSQGPGPANYSIPKIYSSKMYSFGIKTQHKDLSKNFPGPGVYDPQKIKNVIAISFQNSKRPSLQGSPQNQKPGPGQYNSSPSRQQKNKFSFSKRQKFFEDIQQIDEKKKLPGPGLYSNFNVNSIKKQVNAIKFGKTKREYLGTNSKVPGPSDYSPTNQARKKSPIAIIGNSPKGSMVLNKNPGPSQYNSTQLDKIKQKGPFAIFAKASRDQKINLSSLKIGPGSYNIDFPERGRAYSISGRHDNHNNSNSPGPLSYSPRYQNQFRKTQTAIIGKDSKFHLKNQQIPGPGTYNSSEINKFSKTFYFPKQIRKQNLNNYPGPGSYQIKSLIGSEVSKEKQ